MSYEVVQAGLKTQIDAIAAFTADVQTSLADWRILAGGVPHGVILEYGGYRAEVEAYGGPVWVFWTVRVHLFVRYVTEADTADVHNELRDRRQDILNRIFQYPRLNATAGVFFAFPIRGRWGDPQMVEIGGVSFFHEIIEVEIQEDVSVTLQE